MQTCDLLGFSFTGTYQELQQEVIQLVPWVPWGAKRWQKMPIGANRCQEVAKDGKRWLVAVWRRTTFAANGFTAFSRHLWP